ncbi:MAG: hypothetical protein WCI22_01760 [Actinomycetota bacterium]
MELATLLSRGLVTRHADQHAGHHLEPLAAARRTLPLLAAFTELVPQGVLQRGSVVACEGPAAVSLALALAAGPSHDGCWVGLAALPFVGLGAAAELGLVLERVVAVIDPPTPFTEVQWADLVAAFVDGFDIVVLGPTLQQLRPATVRRVRARVQSRGAVVITVGVPVFGADVRFVSSHPVWQGLGQGHGVAHGRVAQVQCAGRRMPATRQASLWLPTADGEVAAMPQVSVAQVPVASLRDVG